MNQSEQPTSDESASTLEDQIAFVGLTAFYIYVAVSSIDMLEKIALLPEDERSTLHDFIVNIVLASLFVLPHYIDRIAKLYRSFSD